jgi:plastocyanin
MTTLTLTPKHSKRTGLLVGLLAAGVLVAALAMLAMMVRGPVDVKDFKFAPPVLTVASGARVTWTNHDEEPHTITSTTAAFGSAGLSRDDTFTQTFTRPGTYEYFCALHPYMKATVVVR